MFRRLSTGEVVNPAWTLFFFPTRWHYDVLMGLDYLRRAGVVPDERCAEAIDLVEKRRGEDADGHWRTLIPVECTSTWRRERAGPAAGTPCGALRVLDWYELRRAG
ncbi:MAG: hypothetical protein ACRDV9_08635 [Acidimicrobiia bacterium]